MQLITNLFLFDERRLLNKKLTNMIGKRITILTKDNICNILGKFEHQTLEFKLLNLFFYKIIRSSISFFIDMKVIMGIASC